MTKSGVNRCCWGVTDPECGSWIAFLLGSFLGLSYGDLVDCFSAWLEEREKFVAVLSSAGINMMGISCLACSSQEDDLKVLRSYFLRF